MEFAMPRNPLILSMDDGSPALDRAAGLLRAGGLVALPTETFYGLAVDPRSPSAVRRLLELKGYGEGRSLLLLAADREQVSALARLDEEPWALRLAEAFWPGPLTLVLALRRDLPACPRGTVAVRIPGRTAARQVAAALGHALTGTSANHRGRPAASTAADVVAGLGAAVDLVLDGGPAPGGVPSTIVDPSGPRPALIRAGRIPTAEVEAVLGCRLRVPGGGRPSEPGSPRSDRARVR
jgi:L-threonylcarbamoyladenylate synthase